MRAMPMVKPSTTGQGMYARKRPTPANAATTTITPAMIPTTITALGTEARDHGDEHDRHRAGRARHLHVGATEHRGDESRDDRGHQSGLRAEPGGDAEPERERQRHDTDGHAGDEIAAPRAAHPRSRRAAGASRSRRGMTAVAAPPRRRGSSRCSRAHGPAAFRPARSSVDSLNDTIMKRFAAARSSASSGARSE